MADGFTVDRAALAQTAQRINDLRSLVIDDTAAWGRGLSRPAVRFAGGRRDAGPGVQPVPRPVVVGSGGPDCAKAVDGGKQAVRKASSAASIADPLGGVG